jgi:hypothetical protein
MAFVLTPRLKKGDNNRILGSQFATQNLGANVPTFINILMSIF